MNLINLEKMEGEFRIYVLTAINRKIYDPGYPRNSYSKIVNGFRKKAGRINQKLGDAEFNYFGRIFVEILKFAGKNPGILEEDFPQLSKKSRAQTVITPQMNFELKLSRNFMDASHNDP